MRFLTSGRTIGLVRSVHLPICEMTLGTAPGSSFPERSPGSVSTIWIQDQALEFALLWHCSGSTNRRFSASAEKYVQQGKLQNAIAEYEKVLKNDAKDLTVTNTVGDLYSRLGETR